MKNGKIPEEQIREFLDLLQNLSQAQYAGKRDAKPEETIGRGEKLVQSMEKSVR